MPAGDVVDDWSKGTLLEIFIDFFFLFSNHLLQFVFLPDVDPLQEGGAAVGEVALVLPQDGFEGALDINFVLAVLVSLQQLLLGLQALRI